MGFIFDPLSDRKKGHATMLPASIQPEKALPKRNLGKSHVTENDEQRDIVPFEFVDRDGYKIYRKRLWNRNPCCHYCGKRTAWEKSTLDHIIPKAQGGLDTPSNLVLACEQCNQTKANRSMVEWRDDLIQACERVGESLVVECCGVS